MSPRRTAQVSSRKQPKQARSADLVAAVLQAAVQVLAQEGAQRFTTARVAEKAGVSVGSLYQYFPNKASILFRLQSDEWRRTTDMMRKVLQDETRPPLARLRALVRAFLLSEFEEAAVRGALDDAAPLYRDAPEAREARAEGSRIFARFMREALPKASPRQRERGADLVVVTMTTAGKAYSERARSAAEMGVHADAMSEMFCAYLASVETGSSVRTRGARLAPEIQNSK